MHRRQRVLLLALLQQDLDVGPGFQVRNQLIVEVSFQFLTEALSQHLRQLGLIPIPNQCVPLAAMVDVPVQPLMEKGLLEFEPSHT